MNNRKTNTLSIIAFIVSIFSLIIGTILCLISLSQIKETNEKGKGFALGGIAINVVKIAAVILLFVLYMFTPSTLEAEEYKCKNAVSCEYHNESQTYTCTYNNDGVEEYISCDADLINKEKPVINDGTTDDPDNDDTFDYDREEY